MTLSRLRKESRATGPGDLALVRAFLAGDEEASRTLAGRVRCVPLTLRSLNARAGRPLGDADLADVVQDTTVILLRKLAEFDGRAPLDAWAYRLCQLELYNAIRRKRRRPAAIEDEVLEGLGMNGSNRVSSMEDEARRGLSTLHPVERDIVQLKHFEGLTFEVIGERLSLSPNTAKTRYYRGLKKLQQFMEGSMNGNERDAS